MNIEIWSDIACPWCYIGKRRFEAALAGFEHRDDVRVTWRSFELDPAAQMTDTAAGEGLDFRFDIARSGSTFDGHRLVHLAAEHGLQDAMKERLLRAYFGEGELMSDHETLVRLAGEVGVPEDEARQMLAGDRFAAEVREDEQTAARFGISAVPTFVVDRSLGVSGAHPPEALLELLHEGWARRAPVSIVAGGEACGVDGSC
jgi:predicted DsbA family dithiol-disulfide isomerase